MIIAVGFKVNSERAVQFRKWVNQIAKDYTIKMYHIELGIYLSSSDYPASTLEIECFLV